MEKKTLKRGRPAGTKNSQEKKPRPENGEFVILGRVYFDRERIAKELGGSLSLVQRLHANGLLKYISAGHYKVSAPEWIAEYIQQRATDNQEAAKGK